MRGSIIGDDRLGTDKSTTGTKRREQLYPLFDDNPRPDYTWRLIRRKYIDPEDAQDIAAIGDE